MSKEAMKLALEALKTAEDFDIDADDGYYLKAINALEEALAKQEHDCTRSHPHEQMSKECELRTEVARLKNQQAYKSQAQLQLKMTALEKAWFDGYEDDINNALQDLRQEIVSLATAKQEQGEPHSWYSVQEDEWMTEKTRKDHERLNSYTHKVGGFDLPLYTTPQQRTWVGLTDEDLAVCGDEDDVMLARYWERVCKEKNT